MWALKMKPVQRERWETYFDRKRYLDAKLAISIMKPMK